MTPLERLRHLLAMAAADKRMNEAELGFLSERAAQLGISHGDFHDALQAAVSGETPLAIPERKAERRALLKDLIRMMAADGILHQLEKELFAQVAVTMDLSSDDLHQVIDATIAEDT
jgi:uncharacterized tellurite resistance protein B-like protein